MLLAEDNPVNQMVAAEILKRLGCRVDIVGNGKEAVEAVRRLPYDLVFLDCHMPVMDGFEACRRIRAREEDGLDVFLLAEDDHLVVHDDQDPGIEQSRGDVARRIALPVAVPTSRLYLAVPPAPRY